ncbi:MAG: dTDP-4-dehydrorhamnose reductase [Lysobacter sp.]|nr:dTDP-4-dehydrorhamnose reductase [Lysobacter sp.]
MKILLFGANGQVGHELRRSLAPLGEIVATTRSGRLDGGACEVADFDSPDALPALIERIAPSLVVNAAAYTAVDKAESDRDAAFRANGEAPSRIAETCARIGIPLVHYSTDYVFDGTGNRPYREDDPTAPLGVYGESKLAGEQGIRASGAAHMILRTAWVYAAHGKNFLRTMLRLGAERDTLGVVADQIGTPTSAGLIADVTAVLVPRIGPASGTWHLTASGEISWHAFAEAIFAGAVSRGLLPRAPTVHPISTADYPTPARRPAYSRLDTSRLRGDFGVELPEWRTVCDHVLDDIAGSTSR